MDKTRKPLSEKPTYSVGKILFFVMFIPIVFAIGIAYVILNTAGVNVLEKAKSMSEHIPSISASSIDEKEGGEKASDSTGEIQQLKQTLTEKDKKIHSLMDKLNEKEMTIEELQIQTRQLKGQLADAKAANQNEKPAIKEVVSTYEKMTPKKAAPILAELEEEQAVYLLGKLRTDQRTAILEKMEPATAAKFTALLAEQADMIEE